MKDRRSRVTSGRIVASGLFTASLAVGSLTMMADTAGAKVRGETFSYGICEMLQRDPVDPALLEQLRARADFAQIVEFAEQNCGDVLDTLVGPTETITPSRDNRNGDRGNPTVPGDDTPDTPPDEEDDKDDETPEPEPEPEPEVPEK